MEKGSVNANNVGMMKINGVPREGQWLSMDGGLHIQLPYGAAYGKDEDGNEKTEKAIVSAMDPNDPSTYSEYARFFDDGCKGWTKDPELNLLFLRRQQDAATDLLRSRGYLTLNEVYRMLGMQTTKAGVIVGWVYDKDHPVGDNYVDFGIYDINRPKNRDFVNGYERVILLDFNVDGNIYDLM